MSGRILVAEIGQRIIGLAAVLARVIPNDPDEEQTPYAYISDLVVLPEYRGRGVGHALLEQAESYARSAGATILRINVLAKNEDAARLYANFGFTDYRVQLVKRLP
jgi:ribosomal protein S18 acetylase RimI-like enzyme